VSTLPTAGYFKSQCLDIARVANNNNNNKTNSFDMPTAPHKQVLSWDFTKGEGGVGLAL